MRKLFLVSILLALLFNNFVISINYININHGNRTPQLSQQPNNQQPEKTTDNNNDPRYLSGKCSSQSESNNFYRYDLGSPQHIKSVFFVASNDMHLANRFYQLRVGNSQNIQLNPECSPDTLFHYGGFHKCDLVGRYVSVNIPLNQGARVFDNCEFRIYLAQDIAYNQIGAVASNPLTGFQPQKLFQGVQNNLQRYASLYHNAAAAQQLGTPDTCIYAQQQQNGVAYWGVTLDKIYQVYTVIIGGRYDKYPAYYSSLTNYKVHVGNNPDILSNPTCGGTDQTFTGDGDIVCNLSGQYVGISVAGRDLTFCGIGIFGESCHSSCATCSGPNANQCETCVAGKVFHSETKTCNRPCVDPWADCSYHGQCYPDGLCVCVPGFKNFDCSVPTCQPHYCSHHGTCNEDSSCSCDHLWQGADCSQAEAVDPNTCCSQHGYCHPDHTCTCIIGFEGPQCQVPNCAPHFCNHVGQCNADGSCTCPSTNRGQACEQLVSTECTDCSGNGSCTPNGCVCNPGFEGNHCQRRNCAPHYCYLHGLCDQNSGECHCEEGYTGSACEESH